MRRLTLIFSLALVGNSVTAGNLCESPHSEVQAICSDVNKLRAHEGLNPLRADRQLNREAEAYARELSARGDLTHGDFHGRMIRAGIAMPAAENIAEGDNSPDGVIKRWISSPLHYQNMVGEKYTRIGVGYHGGYWVQLFN